MSMSLVSTQWFLRRIDHPYATSYAFSHHASSCTFYYLLSYQSGDMSVVLDTKVKEMVCEMSGKDDVSEPT